MAILSNDTTISKK